MIERMEVNGLTVTIDQDPDGESPREWVNGCDLVMWGKHYNFPNDAGIDIGAYPGWPAIELELLDRADVLVTAPVWVYEHSGIALSTGTRSYPFDCPWDSAQCGVAYVTAKNWTECQGTEWTGSDDQRATALEMIAGDVATYSQYLNGEVYCYSVTDAEGEVVDSCGGMYGYDYVVSEAKAAAQREGE